MERLHSYKQRHNYYQRRRANNVSSSPPTLQFKERTANSTLPTTGANSLYQLTE